MPPGVKVSGPGIRDSYVQRDGTSVAAALTAGSCALLMEWGQKLPFSRYLSTYEMKNLLIRGAIRNPDLFLSQPGMGIWNSGHLSGVSCDFHNLKLLVNP